MISRTFSDYDSERLAFPFIFYNLSNLTNYANAKDPNKIFNVSDKYSILKLSDEYAYNPAS